MRLIVFLLSLTIFTGFLEAQEKKTAALAPLASMGDLDEIQKRVIFNTLQESLSKYYILSSQKMYERAEEEAFQQMDASECTEDQCIAIIQELLQVEYFFMFEILQSDDFQQLKITRVDLDGNRDVRTTTCESCKISQTNSKVDQLVLSIFEIYNAIDNKIVTTNNQTTRELGASAFWEMIKDSEDKLKYQDFINKFPDIVGENGHNNPRIQKIFYPIPNSKVRLEKLNETSCPELVLGSLSRTNLFLSWACLNLTARSVHCNIGRPLLWIYPPAA